MLDASTSCSGEYRHATEKWVRIAAIACHALGSSYAVWGGFEADAFPDTRKKGRSAVLGGSPGVAEARAASAGSANGMLS